MKNTFKETEKNVRKTLNLGYKVAKYIYYPKIRCYKCKTFIPYNAHRCSKCLTDFTNNVEYARLTQWQNIGTKVSYGIAGLFFLGFIAEGSVMVGIISGLFIIGLSKFLIQKIQSVRNYFH